MTDQPKPDDIAPKKDAYTVLARKYRPSTFDTLIGQEAMVRTLTNAIDSGRLAQAFMLTGVRGVGKTTTARLISRALNCVGADGQGGPTITPCGVCNHCIAIGEGRHVDVMEMDAASRTGVDDIREIIEGVRYRPTSARYKIYIIDEVHMLSKGAFNALLKTLEEPPEHVKFLFATTEIRRVPVTVLSRCQRFDLRRIDQKLLADHFANIASKEGAKIADGALQMIARAADGSVRDGLSLLDQAIAHCGGEVGEEQVRDMLGLADRGRTFDLIEQVLKGDIVGALAIMADLYSAGADPVIVLQDLLELTHWLTRIKIVPDAAEMTGEAEMERVRGKQMGEKLSMPVLARTYQMLLKGLEEVRSAPSALQACEMVLIRIAFVAELPTPVDAMKKLQSSPPNGTMGGAMGGAGGAGAGAGGTTARGFSGTPPTAPGGAMREMMVVNGGMTSSQTPNPVSQNQSAPVSAPDPQTFEAVIALAEEKREMILKANLFNNVHLVSFEPGKLEISLSEHAPQQLPGDLKRFLDTNTSRRWAVSISRAAGAPTLAQIRSDAENERKKEISQHPLVKAILLEFPNAKIKKVHDILLDSSDALPAFSADSPDSEFDTDLTEGD